MEKNMTIKKLFDDMFNYNNDSVGDIFPMDMSCFYYDIWNDWRNDNQIKLVDALSLWDYIIKTEWIDNSDCDSLDVKTVMEKIRLLKIECDF